MFKLLGGAVLINLVLIWLVQINAVNQFWIFGIWAFVFVALNIYVLKRIFKELKFDWRKYIKSILPGLIITFILAILPRLFLQGIYPHISQWDELRDAGLHGLRMSNTDNVSIFGFGSYLGYGNFVGLTSYYAIKIFGQTALSYTVPAMMYGTLAVSLFYIILAKYKGQRFAILASVIYSVSMSQLQFSRADVCLITDAFVAMLLFIAALLAKKNLLGYVIFGLIAGLTWHYYAGSRLILLCLIIILGFYELKKSYFDIKIGQIKQVGLRLSKMAGYFLGGFVISIGPTFLFLNKITFFSTHGVSYWLFGKPDFVSLGIIQKAETVVDLYQQSFFTYINAPLHNFNINFSFMPTTLLAFPLNYFFVIGLFVVILKSRGLFNKIVLGTVLMFPFFSQTLADKIAYVHRLQGIVPFATIIGVIGMLELFKLIRDNRKRNIAIYLFVIVFYFSQLVIFFGGRVVDTVYNKKIGDYMLQQALADIAKEQIGKNYYILNKAPYDFSPVHYREKVEYLTSPRNVKIVDSKEFLKKLSDEIKLKDENSMNTFIVFSENPKLNISKDIGDFRLKEVKYICNQKYFGILYDCPTGVESYSYYVYEIK